ncbi:MAG: DUF2927 domain-containing protein [Rhodospirillales bacterium]|nr:DUF2927 domain-containing protein [Rhodospirillales bacterium]
MVHRFLIIGLLVLGGCTSSLPDLRIPTALGEALPTSNIPIKSLAAQLTGPLPDNSKTTSDLYLRSFEALIFTTEWGAKNDYIRKWNIAPISYRVYDGAHQRLKMAISDTAAMLSDIAGLEIQGAIKTKGNIRIQPNIFSDTSYICGFSFYERKYLSGMLSDWFLGDGTIRQTEIYVSSNLEEKTNVTFEECAFEEMSQILGIWNDADVVKHSKWRNRIADKSKRLTWHDAIILRTLYDFRIKPGMHKDQALPIAKVIIKELLDELNS